MYIYDTREKSHKTLPLGGWFFPCITCGNITGQIVKKKTWKNMIFPIHYNIPFCNKCNKYNKTISYINEDKIKYQY